MSTASRAAVKQQERVVFSTGIEGLFVRGLGDALDAPTRQALRELGVDLERLRPGYPVDTWQKAIDLVVARSLGDRSRAEAHRHLGERSVLGLGDTLLGKAMVAMAKVVGPRRSFQRLPHSIRTGDNFSDCRVEEKGEGWFEVTVQPFMLLPEFMEGVLSAVITLTGGQQGQVRTLEHLPAQELVRLEARWR